MLSGEADGDRYGFANRTSNTGAGAGGGAGGAGGGVSAGGAANSRFAAPFFPTARFFKRRLF